MKNSTALYIGRFQPFHLGHLSIVHKILAKNDHIIIAIGSSQESGTDKNPFSAKQRETIIRETLKAENVPGDEFSIVHVPDINDYGFWPIHVTKLVPPYQKIYTGSQIVKDCYLGKYSDDEQKRGLPTPEIVDIVRKIPISGTKIRELMRAGDDSWQEMVHPAAISAIG